MGRPIPNPDEVLAEVRPTLQKAGRLVLCHIVRAEGSTPGKAGWRLLSRPDGTVVGNLGGGAFEALVKADASRMLADGQAPSELKRYYFTEAAVRGEPTGMVCGGFAEVFLESMIAPPIFVICGGGPVGQALAAVASPAGYDLLVIDDREEFRQPDLYPLGTRFAAVGRDFD